MTDKRIICKKCGDAMKEIDVESEKMNWVCPNCAPESVLESPAVK